MLLATGLVSCFFLFFFFFVLFVLLLCLVLSGIVNTFVLEEGKGYFAFHKFITCVAHV